jgi:hypothetical protein
MVLTLVDSLKKGSTYSISYVPGNIQSHDEGHLAAFENLSVYNLLNDYTYIHVVPNKVEAEECDSHQGSGATSCSDVGGGTALTFTRSGGWADYFANVSQSGKYTLEYRISSAKDTGQVQLITKGISASPLNLPVTGSYSAWQTVSTTIDLLEGPQMIRMSVLHGGFYLNWIQFTSMNTGVEKHAAPIQRFQIYQNSPNPFNPSTKIEYTLQNACHVTLKVYNMLGQDIATLVNERQGVGLHIATFDASRFTSGVYFYQINAENYNATKKMILMK